MKLSIKLNDGVQMPHFESAGAAAFVLAAEKDYVIRNINAEQKAVMVSTGVSVAIPKGYTGFLYLRSSMCKTTMRMSNHVGVIDSDYRGEVGVIVVNLSNENVVIPHSERIAQFPCCINTDEIKVYDKNGCEISQLNNDSSCGCSINVDNYSPQEIAVIDDNNKSGVNFMNVGTIVNNSNPSYIIGGPVSFIPQIIIINNNTIDVIKYSSH